MTVNAQALKVVNIARSQIGVHESPSGSNTVKYNTWFYGRAVSGGDYSWCATFLDWLFEQAGCGKLYPHNANAAYGQNEIVTRCGGKWILRQNVDLKSRKSYVHDHAQVGDIVDFNFGKKLSSYRQHTGIVVGIKGDYLVTIEGNTSNGNGSQSNGGVVAQRERHYRCVVSAARPKWATGKVTTKPTTKPSTVKPTNPKLPTYKNGNTYTLIADCLNVRTGAGTNYRTKKKGELTHDGQKHANANGQLRKGTRVTCNGSKVVNGNVWMKIPSGWVCAYYQGKKYIG